ncbi:Fic family protein [Angulomicrobium tetraedrale]|uniref:Fic family protein n=1 Tax=Ancylobacter tetraedralis TaxID=217068 RepID=A0A839ZEW7_9HYPH|nr:Fic/DOC family N-terminal domain-containing protein [Ancylobacter tetraedralis]MBB3773238.1 Fic family protein [Ancylobacter tetraedralis]
MNAVLYHQGRFPPPTLDWPQLLPLIGPANAAIARYAGLLHGIPNPNVLLSPMTVQEAVLSSRIEGTQATMGEVLELEAEGGPLDESTPKKADIREVLNYRAALNEATRLLETLPLSQRLIRDTHRVLMQGVRGRSKDPGEYRRIPNWIGTDGCTIEQARFVPAPADKLPGAMDAWEAYLHADAPDVLIQLAIAHAEFEAIHPFLDGNGRLGRLLVPLFLFSRGLLARPNFYLSEYLESHRAEYYDRLLAISRDDDWTGWCGFFLRALIAQAETNQNRVQAILALYQARKDWIAEETHSQYAVRALDWMFQRPIFRASDFRDAAGIPAPTATRIIRICRDNGLLRELRAGSGRRAAVLCFPELLNLAEGHNAF